MVLVLGLSLGGVWEVFCSYGNDNLENYGDEGRDKLCQNRDKMCNLGLDFRSPGAGQPRSVNTEILIW